MNQIYEEEISIKELFEIFLKRKRIIMISIIITTILSIGYAFVPLFEKSTEYEASSSISIVYNYKAPQNPEEIGEGYVYYQDRLQNTMIPTINGYAHSLSILRSIISELDLKDNKGALVKADKLAKDIKIESQSDSNLIMITAKYKKKQVAEDIANNIPEKLIQMAKANPDLSNYKINIIDFAMANEIKESSKLLTIIVGMLLGLVIGIILAFAIAYSSKKIQSSSQVRSVGLDIDMTIIEPIELEKQKRLLSILMLTNEKVCIIGVEDLNTTSFPLEFNNLAKANNIDSEILSYTDAKFLIKAKESNKAFIVVQEDKSDIKTLKELAKLINKYNINNSVIYIEK